MLGFLWQSLNRCPQLLKEKSYKAIVRPKLEYCSCICDPYQQKQKYVDQLEMVEHRTARFVKSVPHRRTKPPTSVSAMVSDLGWEPLQTRRLHGRLNTFFKITRGMVELLQSTIQFHCTSRQLDVIPSNSSVFTQPSVDAYKYAFFPRTIPAWNALPVEPVEAESLQVFKLRLQSLQ